MATGLSVYAQTFTNYTIANMSENMGGTHCFCTAVDPDDNFWVGTREGLSKFDGENWTIYTTEDGLIGHTVTDIVFDEEHNVYVATSSGISIFNGETWTSYTYDDGLPDSHIATIALDHDKNIWVGSVHGVAKFDGTKWTTYNEQSGYPYTSIEDIKFDQDGIGWFVSIPDGLIKYEDDTWTEYVDANGETINAPFCIDVDLFNNKWVGTSSGAYMLNKNTSRFYTKSDGVAGQSIYGIHADMNGNIWLGTSYGASKFDGAQFKKYRKSSGLVTNEVQDISSDSKGNIFFCTPKGVSKFDGNSWSTIKSKTLLSNDINGVSGTANGNIWLGTYKEVIQITDTGWVQHTDYGGVYALATTKNGNIWVSTGAFGRGSNNGVACYDGNSWKLYNNKNTPLSDGLAVHHISEDKDGNIWFGGDRTYIVRFDGTDWKTFDIDAMPSAIITDSENNVWVGTSSKGLAKFDGQTWTFISESDGFNNKHVSTLAIDSSGNLWIGTSEGVSKYDGTNFTTYTTDDGLPVNSVTNLAVDSDNGIWISHIEGLSVFKDNTFTNYSTENGLLSKYSKTMYIDSKNNVWYGTQYGLSVISPESPYLNISKKTLAVRVEESAIDSFAIHSNTSWHITTNSPWIKCHKTQGIENDVVKVTCNENKSGTVRLGEIYVRVNGMPAETIKVEQGIADKNLEVSAAEFNLAYSSDAIDKSFNITSNTSWTVVCESDWITVENQSGDNTGTVSFKASPNRTVRERMATINVHGTGANSANIVVTQKAETPMLNISANSIDVPYSRTLVNVEITSNTFWSISSENNWLEFDKLWGFGNTTVPLYVNANSDETGRNGRLTISPINSSPVNVTVNQNGFGTSGIGETSHTDEFVFLNKATQNISVNYSDLNRVEIYNLYGKILRVCNKNEIDISSYKSGIYIVLVVKNDNTRYTHKLIK